MIRRTIPSRLAMASTAGGMRRILKRRPPLVKLIRQAVESGTYKSNNPPEDLNLRQRGRGRRGKEKLDPYPMEYEILSLNPPIPDLPRVPTEIRRERSKAKLPTDELVKKYLRRRDREAERLRPPSSLGEDDDEERAYASLLGVPSQDKTTAMGRKAGVLNDAYEFAVKQREILRTNDGMTERESIQVVEELLSKERREERFESRRKAKDVQDWRNRRDEQEESKGKEASEAGGVGGKATTAGRIAGETSRVDGDDGSTAIPSILHSKPRTLLALNVWSSRLRAVPYDRWTIGAATALDHWIASDVLGYDDRTWDAILDGGMDDPKAGTIGRMRDLVTVRGALFPETLTAGGSEDEEEERAEEAFEAAEEKTEKKKTAADKSIEELLERLGEFDDDDDDDMWNFDTDADADKRKEAREEGSEDGVGDVDEAVVSNLVDELQDWRKKNVERPYEEWDGSDKEEFNKWLGKYLAVVASDASDEVDVASTRENLLSVPPSSKEESDAFWDSIRDETAAEMFLQSLLEDARNEQESTNDDTNLTEVQRKQKSDREAFLSLPYEIQLRKLIDLGTLRPMFDEYSTEYATESDRIEFLSRHGDALLEGTDVEHLVPDPNGPIAFEDVEDLIEQRTGRPPIDAAKRYRIEKIKYGTDEYGTERSERARTLWKIWNEHKAGRARYEETMFKRGKLGLTYLSPKTKKRRGRKYDDLL